MKNKILLVSLLLIALALLTSGCSGSASTASSWPGVAVNGSTAYVAYNQHVYAVNLENGLERWRFPQEAKNTISFFAPPVLTSDNQLLVGGYDKILYSLDAANGAEKWSFKNSPYRFIASPLATDSMIYAPSAGAQVFALDLNGNEQWKFPTQGPQWAQPVNNEPCTCIFVPSMDHHIYAIDSNTGEEKWQTDDLGGSVVGTPAWDNGTLYVGTFAGEMLAIDAESAEIRWRTKTNGWVWGGPALRDGRLYFGDLNGTFYAMNAADGSIAWQLQPDGPIAETPLLKDDTIYFATASGTLYAVDLNGNITWSREVGGKLYAPPQDGGDLILVAPVGKDELLVALDTNGNIRWSFIPAK